MNREELRKTSVFMINNKQMWELFYKTMSKLGEDLSDIEDESIFNQIIYCEYFDSRKKWVFRNVFYGDKGKKIVPLIPTLSNICDNGNIEFYYGFGEGLVCVECEGEIFNILL